MLFLPTSSFCLIEFAVGSYEDLTFGCVERSWLDGRRLWCRPIAKACHCRRYRASFGAKIIRNNGDCEQFEDGVDLLSDVGITQNIIQNKNGDDPDFYNTAWTLQLIRGPVLWLLCSVAAVPLAHLYSAPILALVLPIAALYFICLGFTSISVPLTQRRLKFARLNSFDLFFEFSSAVAHVLFSYLSPTVWAAGFRRPCPPYSQDDHKLFPVAGSSAQAIFFERIRLADFYVWEMDFLRLSDVLPVHEL